MTTCPDYSRYMHRQSRMFIYVVYVQTALYVYYCTCQNERI